MSGNDDDANKLPPSGSSPPKPSSETAKPSDGEPLFAPSTVRLFGRKFGGLALTGNLFSANHINNPIATLLSSQVKRSGDKAGNDTPPPGVLLARIYGFSYTGVYYPTPDVPVMLVFDPGTPVEPGFLRNTLEVGGFAFSGQAFVDGVTMWELDSLDAAVRIDVTVGWLKDILMDDAMGQGGAGAPDRPDMNGRARATGTGHVMTMMQRTNR